MSYAKSVTRVVLTSFAAGAGAMALVGLVAPVAMKGGLSMRDAAATPIVRQADLIEPLDLPAIEAQLERADRTMDAMRAMTDDEVAQLERLAR